MLMCFEMVGGLLVLCLFVEIYGEGGGVVVLCGVVCVVEYYGYDVIEVFVWGV